VSSHEQHQPAKVIVEAASKTYRTKTGLVHALEDFSMVVREGEFVCVIGPSGCGKSTLLWSMAGLHALSHGRILLDGKPVIEPNAQIGMVFQEPNLLPWRTLQRNIELPFEFKRRKTQDHRDRIDALLKRVGLVAFKNKYPRELSGGMQQRASIVRSLSFDPSVLLMDEPFGALDAFTRDEMNLLIQEIWMETGKTIVFITHNIHEAVFLADRILVMTPRPGRLSRVYAIDLPRPRLLALTTKPEFIGMVAQIRASINHDASAMTFASDEIRISG
jgi:NitT/TauT family transport system ATP-binding protein